MIGRCEVFSSSGKSPTHPDNLLSLLEAALIRRASLLDARHETALRLFSGFYEGCPDLVIDLYASTLVIFNHSKDVQSIESGLDQVVNFYRLHLPWLRAAVLKHRGTIDPDARRGKIIWGGPIDRRISENGVRYALDLTLSQDATFYLDTRFLRTWLKDNLRGKSVLNTFAYTGSLGVAARAAGATSVTHLDANRKYLNLAKDSYTLNGFPINKSDFIAGDFWTYTSRLRRAGTLFDCVIVDPPFFAESDTGRVDLLSECKRVINKARPLISNNGYLVAVNNALYLSGTNYLQVLNGLCSSGYMQIETLIPVPDDVAVDPSARLGSAPVDPAPFNHTTKIALLRVQRKDKCRGSDG